MLGVGMVCRVWLVGCVWCGGLVCCVVVYV